MSTELKLGQLIEGNPQRDAIHIAVIPMVAIRTMKPGEHLKNGCVDPFLNAPVQPGQRFWLFLYPNTVTSLRHVWEHAAFPTEPELPEKRRSEADVWAEQTVLMDQPGTFTTVDYADLPPMTEEIRDSIVEVWERQGRTK